MRDISCVVQPHGRDYWTEKGVVKAWESGKDFTVCTIIKQYGGRYLNVQDAEMLDLEVWIRFNKLRGFICVRRAKGQ